MWGGGGAEGGIGEVQAQLERLRLDADYLKARCVGGGGAEGGAG